MMMRTTLAALAVLILINSSAHAAEICGNGQDDDADNLADEGCYPTLTTGVCESPLSCNDSGMVSPLTGSSRFQLPPDVAPKVPFGSGIGLRRFYTSQYAPTAGAPVWRKPLGDRWQHTYMTWIIKSGVVPSSKLVLHTNRGQDIYAAYASSSGGWDYYTPQPGFHVKHLAQRQAAPNEFELRMLTGEILVYNSAGRLTQIWDQPDPTTSNKVLVAYDANGQVSTVTDASGKRRLLFAYASGRISTVQFQLFTTVWATQHTASYAYASSLLSTVTIGGSLAQSNTYASNYLTQIQDAAGKLIVGFAYTATAGQVARVDTPRGMIGFEYNSSRPTCSGKTVVAFNRGSTASCLSDANCGAGFVCGGMTTGATPGTCFRAARCLTTASIGDDVVTNVAPLGPPSESCTGACTDVAQYLWDTAAGKLDLQATQDPAGNFSARLLDSNGLPTTISYGDADSNATSGDQARTEFRVYGDVNWPGKVTEIRRKSDLESTGAACSLAATGGCAMTLFDYDNTNGRLVSTTQSGFMRSTANLIVPYSYVTGYSYDTKGRLTQIDGPLAGANDVTVFEYFVTSTATSSDFLRYFKRKKDATTFLIDEALTYDFWGNVTGLLDADGTVTCLQFSAARGHLTQRREAMAAQTSCGTTNGADLVTSWARDSNLRLTQLTRPDGSCLFFEYDTRGRLQHTKRRDDCIAASAGDRQTLIYDTEGLVTEVQTFDAANVMTGKQPFTYFDSRQLEKIINPVDASKWTGIVYDARGLVSQVDGAGGLGKTVFKRDDLPGRDGRVTAVDKYKTSTAFDTWSQLYAWLGAQKQVIDGDGKITGSERDDLGRMAKLSSPDMQYPKGFFYDAASRRTTLIDAFTHPTAGSERVHTFTFDNLGRPLNDDYEASCGGPTTAIEVQRSYDTLPTGITCPVAGACARTQGRLAYVKAQLMCSSGLGADYSLDQETFYGYDDAGRMIRETVRDDALRGPEQQIFGWTKNGDLAQVTTPSGAVIGWSFGSATSNSDTDRVTSQWRTNTSTQVSKVILWGPFGPLKQYDQLSSVGGVGLRTRISRNLAYRPTGLFTETNTGAVVLHSTVTAEDAKGRITKRDYTPNTWMQDSYFLYDDQDRVLCETTNLVGFCPTSGSNLKNNHSAAPPFTNAGDWKVLHRPIPGTTGFRHSFNSDGTAYGTKHQLATLSQESLGNTTYWHDNFGNRELENNTTLVNDDRTMDFDERHNLTIVNGLYKPAAAWNVYQTIDTFDAKNRRVSRTFTNLHLAKTATWFFYYDPFDRLTEVRHTPDISVSATYSSYQLFWLQDRLVAYWQTDFPSATTSKRYVVSDETNRPIEMWTWPASGDPTRAWTINPSAWGFDSIIIGGGVYQPVLFDGQYQDRDTTAYLDDGVTAHRPGLAQNRFRTYDPFTGTYLQVDPLVSDTWNSYVYVDSDPVNKTDPDGQAVRLQVTNFGSLIGTTEECYSSGNTLEVSACIDGTDPWFGGFGWNGGVIYPGICQNPKGCDGGGGGSCGTNDGDPPSDSRCPLFPNYSCDWCVLCTAVCAREADLACPRPCPTLAWEITYRECKKRRLPSGNTCDERCACIPSEARPSQSDTSAVEATLE